MNEANGPSAGIQPCCDIRRLLEGVIVVPYVDVIAA